MFEFVESGLIRRLRSDPATDGLGLRTEGLSINRASSIDVESELDDCELVELVIESKNR